MSKQIPAAELAQRLKSLPSPAGNLFSRLYKQGLMTNPMARTLIGAAEVARIPKQVMGFATAYHALRSRQVPVIDTIRLAQRFGRQLDLLGSVENWFEEHRRFRRVVELQQATEADESYDTSGCEEFLPERWPGYLIRSSRRLALVCLRLQLNGEYDYYLAKHSDTAVAVVFLNGERWTVALAVDRAEEAPQIRITQIRGMCRRLPEKEERDAIYARLGLTPRSLAFPVVPDHTVDPEIEPLYKTNLRHLVAELTKHNVVRVTLTESTNWKNRDAEGVVVLNAAGDDISTAVLLAQVRAEVERARRADDGWVPMRIPQETSIGTAVYWLAAACTRDTGAEWRKRRSGSQRMVIDLEQGTLDLETRTRSTGRPAYHRHIDIETGQEVEPASLKAA